MVDLTFLRKFAKDDPQKMKRYISLYLDVAPKTFDEMRRNLDGKDWEQLRINAHSLKPQAEFMGIISLKEQLIRIEEAVKAGSFDDMENLYQTARAMSSASANELTEMLKQF